jgi:hypothetical protein
LAPILAICSLAPVVGCATGSVTAREIDNIAQFFLPQVETEILHQDIGESLATGSPPGEAAPSSA